ncbi:hypothetical protein [Actinospica robiniae]|uniref:hypothetical protein n=1 Tax=Actinospica robiniae TaxID=304901 RepID=UPI000554EAD8|nr:hypothetical protein [Actinospica robiniae]
MGVTRVSVGDVFRWPHDDRPIRVLVSDDGVFMYDAWWPHLDAWGLAGLQEVRRQRVGYYVSTVAALLEKATFLRSEPLTDAEVALHRPDLPFCPVRCAAVDWPSSAPETQDQLFSSLEAAGCADVDLAATVSVAKIVLLPFGPQGGRKAGVRVAADDGVAFSAGELLWKAAAVQASCLGSAMPTRGLGIYRSGLQRGVASYYLWGGESKLHAEIASVSGRGPD